MFGGALFWFVMGMVFVLVAAGALLGAGSIRIGLELGRGFAVTSDAILVRCQLEGRPVVFPLFAVAIAAGALLAFYVDELLRRLVVDMMTGLAFVLGRFHVTMMK